MDVVVVVFGAVEAVVATVEVVVVGAVVVVLAAVEVVVLAVLDPPPKEAKVALRSRRGLVM